VGLQKERHLNFLFFFEAAEEWNAHQQSGFVRKLRIPQVGHSHAAGRCKVRMLNGICRAEAGRGEEAEKRKDAPVDVADKRSLKKFQNFFFKGVKNSNLLRY